jgi:hypothetical protein
MNKTQLHQLRSFRSNMLDDLETCVAQKALYMEYFDDPASFGKLMTLTVRQKITTGFIEILNKLIVTRCLLLESDRDILLNKMKIITKRTKIQLVQIAKLSKIMNTFTSNTVNVMYYNKLLGAIYRMILHKTI